MERWRDGGERDGEMERWREERWRDGGERDGERVGLTTMTQTTRVSLPAVTHLGVVVCLHQCLSHSGSQHTVSRIPLQRTLIHLQSQLRLRGMQPHTHTASSTSTQPAAHQHTQPAAHQHSQQHINTHSQQHINTVSSRQRLTHTASSTSTQPAAHQHTQPAAHQHSKQ